MEFRFEMQIGLSFAVPGKMGAKKSKHMGHKHISLLLSVIYEMILGHTVDVFAYRKGRNAPEIQIIVLCQLPSQLHF